MSVLNSYPDLALSTWRTGGVTSGSAGGRASVGSSRPSVVVVGDLPNNLLFPTAVVAGQVLLQFKDKKYPQQQQGAPTLQSPRGARRERVWGNTAAGRRCCTSQCVTWTQMTDAAGPRTGWDGEAASSSSAAARRPRPGAAAALPSRPDGDAHALYSCYYKAAGSSGRDRWRPAMAVYMHIGTKEAGETINDLIQRVRGRAKNEQNPAVQLYYFFPYIQYIWFGVKFFIILLTTTSISTHLLHPTLYWLGRCTFILLHCMHRSRSRC